MSVAATKTKSPKSDNKRGPNTIFRVLYATHLNLNVMADSKANQMLGLNVLILSVLFFRDSSSYLAGVDYFKVPNIILALVCMACIILAILTTRPRLPVKKPDPATSGFNWLFFGHYTAVSIDEYIGQMFRIAGSEDTLNEVMSNDIYWMGVVLDRKYRYLRLLYNVFGIGMPVAVVSFVVFWWLNA
jgi:hypothetical protein